MSPEQEQRMALANQVIKIIGTYGRRFFHNDRTGAYAKFEIDPRGTVWFVDAKSQISIRIDKDNKTRHWMGFSHGGGLRDLVERLYEYIVSGRLVSHYNLGFERYDGSNVWGYPDEDMQKVREEAGALALFPPLATSPASHIHQVSVQ